MGFKSKGTDPKDLELSRLRDEVADLKDDVAALRRDNVALAQENASLALSAQEGDAVAPEFFTALLALEERCIEKAQTIADGPNVDAIKSALRNASHGIAHVRKALKHNGRLA